MGILADNPIIWREGVPRPLRRADPVVQLLCGAAGVLVPLLLAAYWLRLGLDDSEMLGYLVAYAWAGGAVVIALSNGARSIAQERAQGTWDALVVSRLGAAGIVLGKLASLVLPLWAVGLVLLPSCVLLVGMGREGSFSHLVYAYVAATLGGGSLASLGLYCSMRCSSVSNAQLLSFLCVLALAVVSGGLMALLGMPFDTFMGVFGAALFVVPGLLAALDLIVRFNELDAYGREGPGAASAAAARPEATER